MRKNTWNLDNYYKKTNMTNRQRAFRLIARRNRTEQDMNWAKDQLTQKDLNLKHYKFKN